jgi:Domain of Unknown Function with PDB structure (DUF3857)/Transglutaminase-like superfamily
MKKTKHCAILVTFLLTIGNLLAQKKQPIKTEFGKMSQQEKDMLHYSKDPEAPAVILFKKGTVNFTMDDQGATYGEFDYTYVVHERIKIFKKAAYDYANIVITYHPKDYIEHLKASSYYLENDKWIETPLNLDNVVEEHLTNDLYVKKFTIPGVREGSIIEYSYQQYNGEGGYLNSEWTFQYGIPTIWSEYEANIPEHYRYMTVAYGNVPLAVHTDTMVSRHRITTVSQATWRERQQRWVQKDIPAIKPEPMMTSINNYRSRLLFQYLWFYKVRLKGAEQADMNALLEDAWKQLGNELLDRVAFGDALKSNATSTIVNSVIANLKDDKAKVQAIYEYVGKNYELILYHGATMTQPFKELLTHRKGTATELNLLLINMLRKAGITVYPVLASTRSHGELSHLYPILRRVNCVLAYLPMFEKEPLLIDAGGYPRPLGLLPFDDLNGDGFLVQRKDSSSWIPIKNRINSKLLYANTLTLNEKGDLSGDISMTATGHEAVIIREDIFKNGNEKTAHSLLKDLLVDGKMESFAFENTKQLDEKYLKGAFKIKTSAFVTKTDSQMYLSPLLFWAEKENIFKNPERKFDVNFGYARENSYILMLTLPNGYKVESLPKNTKINLENGSFTFTYLAETTGNQLKVNAKWIIKKTVFQKEEYAVLRGACESILNKMAEQIVLSKM